MTESRAEILLVEDNPAEVELTVHALSKEKLCNGIEVARDGEEALDILFRRGPFSDRPLADCPKLILLDLKLPKVNGLEVLREAKSNPQTRMIPVVVFASSKEERDLIESYQLGVNSYIQKPVDFGQFRAKVKALGLYWLAVNQPPPANAFAKS